MEDLPENCRACGHLSISLTHCTLLTSLTHEPYELKDSKQSPPDCCPLKKLLVERKEKDETKNKSGMG